jgi:hypothetical protein
MGPAQVFLTVCEDAKLAMLCSEGDSAVVQKVLKRGNGLYRTSPISFATSQAGCEYIASTDSALCLASSQIFTGTVPSMDVWVPSSGKTQGRQSNIKPADAYYEALAECKFPVPEIGTDFGPSGKLETRCQRQHRNCTVEDHTHTHAKEHAGLGCFDSSQEKGDVS